MHSKLVRPVLAILLVTYVRPESVAADEAAVANGAFVRATIVVVAGSLLPSHPLQIRDGRFSPAIGQR